MARIKLVAVATTSLLALTALTACSNGARSDGIIEVPGEISTLQGAEKIAEPGDVILISAGHYLEELEVTTPDITIRGVDRNEVIIDGEGKRPYGIVVMADGVRVENLTVTDATFYGLLFTGLHDESGPQAPTASNYEEWDPKQFPPLQRFLADHITATNNGLYGIYAFNAQHGAIVNSYASGSADSGFYVGQCVECDILVEGNVAERNAVGFENSNASDSLVVTGNRFSSNRVGVTLLSNYQESFTPQRGNTIVGNVIVDNVKSATPAQATGGFGTGIGISGGIENTIANNLISGHTRAGIIFSNTEDLPSSFNSFVGNIIRDNAVDFTNVSASRAPAVGNCVDLVAGRTSIPQNLIAELATGCDAQSQAAVQASEPDLHFEDAPPGISFRQVAKPKMQPNLTQRGSYDLLPERMVMPNLKTATTPSADLLLDRVGAQ